MLTLNVRRTVVAALAAAIVATAAISAHAQLNLAGMWTSEWSAGTAQLRLEQYGPHVLGVFTNPGNVSPGTMAGRLNGNVATGRWTDATSSGGFVLTFSPDGRSFTGTWGRSLSSNSDGGAWNGRRL